MWDCYADDAEFSDAVFRGLRGADVKAMWEMLCAGGKDLTVTFSGIRADDATGSATWEATYTFSATGRPVHNEVTATFTFRDGLIASHRDSFSAWRWMAMAVGPKGRLLGWLPPARTRARKEAGARLAAFRNGATRDGSS
jgi:hypothetical protein